MPSTCLRIVHGRSTGIGAVNTVCAFDPRHREKGNHVYFLDSDIVYLHLPTPVVIVGSLKAATDLLEKKSQVYSSRPRVVTAKL